MGGLVQKWKKSRKKTRNKLTYEIRQQDHQRDWDDNGTQGSAFPVTVLIGFLQVKGRPREGTSGKGPRGRWVHSAGRQGISRRRCTKKGRSASRFEQEVPEGRKTNSKWLLTQIEAEGDVGWEDGDCCREKESSSTQCWLRTWMACTKEKNKNQRQVTQSKGKQNKRKRKITMPTMPQRTLQGQESPLWKSWRWSEMNTPSTATTDWWHGQHWRPAHAPTEMPYGDCRGA